MPTSRAVLFGVVASELGNISSRICSNKTTSSDINFGRLAFFIALIRTLVSASCDKTSDHPSRL